MSDPTDTTDPTAPADATNPTDPAAPAVREIWVPRDGMELRAIDSGPPDGEPVILLHGFPQRASIWDLVVPMLHADGLRTIVLDQRGYCASARPRGRRAYRISELIGDLLALLDAAGLADAHIVGHDWGAAVAWGIAGNHPERVRSLTAVSVPHPAAFLKAMVTSDQLLRSWYMGFFQLPFIPELVLSSSGSLPVKALAGMGMTREMIERFREEMVADGAIPGGLGWYRALPFASPRTSTARVAVPTTFVWSDDDKALGRGGAALTERFVDGDYQFVELSGVSHWIPEERPVELASAISRRVLGAVG